MRLVRRGLCAPFILGALLLASPVFAQAPAKAGATTKNGEVADLIRQGTSMHDAGRYDEAIARYRQALALDSGNATAWYELAFSYDAKKDYAHCLEATREGLKHPGDQGARLYSQQGNCLDDSGRGADAVASYREGLARYAHDGRLRYNYAVALWRQKKVEAAIPELVTTIGDEPGYDSPYMLLAALQHEQKRDVQALFAFLRYLTVDRTSERSQQAAILALDLFSRGITAKPGAGKDEKTQVEVVLSPDSIGSENGLYSMLALSRSLAAASLHSGDGATDADRVADALASFLAIASEMSAKPEYAETTRGAEWQRVSVPLIALSDRELAKTFGYVVAERANAAGAREWVAKNGAALRQLDAALNAP
jgi:tetratricopeptide (TPR) repeat protein